MTMDVTPTWKKFEAISPQYVDVGAAMREKYWAYSANGDPKDYGYTYRNIFAEADKEELLEFMWHEAQGLKSDINDKEVELQELAWFVVRYLSKEIKKIPRKKRPQRINKKIKEMRGMN